MLKRIETGTPEADRLGFSEELFSGWLELVNDKSLYLHFIISRHRNEGNTRSLLERWLSEGYDVRVVLPRPIMQHILRNLRFAAGREYLLHHYDEVVEVWRRPELNISRIRAEIT